MLLLFSCYLDSWFLHWFMIRDIPDNMYIRDNSLTTSPCSRLNLQQPKAQSFKNFHNNQPTMLFWCTICGLPVTNAPHKNGSQCSQQFWRLQHLWERLSQGQCPLCGGRPSQVIHEGTWRMLRVPDRRLGGQGHPLRMTFVYPKDHILKVLCQYLFFGWDIRSWISLSMDGRWSVVVGGRWWSGGFC